MYIGRRVCCFRVSRDRFECCLFWAYTCCWRLSPFYYDRLDRVSTRLSRQKEEVELEEGTRGRDGEESDRVTLLEGRAKKSHEASLELRGPRE
jgi:hypothetical protein